jgi:hypothetical protein
MSNLAVLSAFAAVLGLTASGCGSDDTTVASDPAGTPSATATPSATPSATAPTASPTPGSLPAYGERDYRYRLTMTCYCPGAGTPIDITVKDGAVTAAAYVVSTEPSAVESMPTVGRGADPHEGGPTPVPQSRQLTIDDIIDAANQPAAKITLDWPAGQAYPSSVYIDQDQQVADDELGYEISDVVVG